LHVFGLVKSLVDEKIQHIIQTHWQIDNGLVEFGILAQGSVIDIKVSVSDEDELIVDNTLKTIKAELSCALGDNIVGSGANTIESVIGEMLVKNRKALAVAESCTGGLLSRKITSIQGSSLYFKFGVVAYSNESKIKILGVNEETIKTFGAVCQQTALEMAEGIRNKADCDYALSITGIAGPSGGTDEKPVGLVFIGLCGQSIREVYKFNFIGNRTDISEYSANKALDLLRRQLLKDS
jgi:nicotinamide-nucleotide amidase